MYRAGTGNTASVCWPTSKIALLLLGVNMPHNVVGQTNDLISSSFSHFSETLGFRLVLKSVAREVNA